MNIFKTSKISSKAAQTYIRTLYNVLLSREPDQEGFDHWTAALKRIGIEGFEQILASFSRSEEFIRLKSLIAEGNDLEKNQEFFFESIQDETISRLFQITSHYWRTNASDPKEIYWSVLTNPKFKGTLSAKTKSEFLSTGMRDVNRILAICERVDYDLENCRSFLDYGCGVGRLVVNLPDSIQRINCVDFSDNHLNEAKSNISLLENKNKYFYHSINSIFDISSLPPNQDIIHSCIVLQHNTPPVIERTARDLLNLLSPGGLAILHIPIAKASYRFDVDNYINDKNSGRAMEMHILPKANIFKLAESSCCEIAFSCCVAECGGDIYSEFIVFRRRPGAS
jgi:SAM-dependent methyltransferase